MINDELIKSVLDGYGVESEVDSIFGGWVVTDDGDVICVEFHYPIYSYQVNDDEWLAQLRGKTWFNKVCESDFLQAFERACEILSIEVVLKPSY